MQLRLAAASLLLAVMGGASAEASGPRPIDEFLENVAQGGRFEPGRVALYVEPTLGQADVRALAARRGCRYGHQFGRRPYHVVLCDPAKPMEEQIRAFSAMEGVRWVEAGFYDELEAVPNDLYELQWYHQNTGQVVDMVGGLPGADMRSADAWEVSTGSPARVVAIVDIGVYTGHQDLAPQVWTNPGENCTNGVDDDGNGYIDDCHGWDIGEDDNDASPLTLPDVQSDGDPCLKWHATYIAGLAAAQGNNNLGLAGTAWDVSIMNLKRHRDSTCQGTSDRAAEATFYAIDNGADALGYSFNTTTRSSMLQDALTLADSRGLIAVMSAGNGGSNINSGTRYPNNYTMTHKIITASTDNRDRLDPGSNYGSTKVDIASPGTFVVSTAIEGPQAYGVGTGTSMSVGFGLAAVTLAKTAYPAATPDQVYQAILQGGRALPALACASSTSRCVRTGRRLDLLGMLQQLRPLNPASLTLSGPGWVEVGNGDGELGPGEQARPTFTVHNAGPGGAFGLALQVQVTSGPGLTVADPRARFGALAANQSVSPTRDVPVVVVPPSCTTDFDAQLALVVTDVLGHTAQGTLTVPVRCVNAVPFDAGVPADSGVVTPDAGGATPDAGVEDPRDGGVLVVRDSGVHNRDGGFLVRDSGVHRDAGAVDPEPLPEGGCTHTGGGAGGLGWAAVVGAILLARRRRLA